MAEEVQIEWPSGNVTVLTNLAANQIVTVTEVVNIEPPRPVTTIDGSVTLTHTLAATARQWYSETGPLAGETGPALTFARVQPAQAGRYTVVAQTEAGAQTNHVYLRVLSPLLATTCIAEGVRLECRGEPNTTYRFEESTDLRVWAEQQTVTTDASGSAATTVPGDPGWRFYRVVKP